MCGCGQLIPTSAQMAVNTTSTVGCSGKAGEIIETRNIMVILLNSTSDEQKRFDYNGVIGQLEIMLRESTEKCPNEEDFKKLKEYADNEYAKYY